MFSYNKVILGGVVCNTPTLRKNESGTSVTNFTLKTTESWKDRNTGVIKRYSKYHRIVAWGKTAEKVIRIAKKDIIVMVEGKLNYHKNGNNRSTAEVKAYVIEYKGRLTPRPKPERNNINTEVTK